MENNTLIPMLDLQLFADGGAGTGTGDGGTAQGAGVSAADAGQQNSGVQASPENKGEVAADAGQEQEDLEAAFEELIKGKFKHQFTSRVKNVLDGRLSGLHKQLEAYRSGQLVFDILAEKYGLSPTEYAAIAEAADKDTMFVEKKAIESGRDPDDELEIAQVRRQNASLLRQEQERKQAEEERRQQQLQRAAQQQESEWRRQAQEAKEIYPRLNLEEEINNPDFARLLRSGVPVKAAYEVVHMNEIMGGAMQYAAKRTAKGVTDSVMAGAARPSENGTSSQSAAVVKSDVSKLSKKDRAEIIRRVQRGEKIRF